MDKIGATMNVLSIEKDDEPNSPETVQVSPDKLFEDKETATPSEDTPEEEPQSLMSKCVTYFP